MHRLAVILVHVARSASARRFGAKPFGNSLRAETTKALAGMRPVSVIAKVLLTRTPALNSILSPRAGIAKLLQVRGGVTGMHGAKTAYPSQVFPIGVPGKPWSKADRIAWQESRSIKRSYHEEVVKKIKEFEGEYDVRQYGSLPIDPQRYPLYAVMTHEWSKDKPSVLVTGGVHGFETSGVQGAILFLQTMPQKFKDTFNILVVPCVSPWGYETIQRWNAEAVDPNCAFNPNGEVVHGRSFTSIPEPATGETSALISLLKSIEGCEPVHSLTPMRQWLCHIDLHETTDADESEFDPAQAARDGVDYKPWCTIPDGFYLVSDETNLQEAWHKAMIDAVRDVTHIAPPDGQGLIIGQRVLQEGVIAIPSPRSLGLCAGVTDAAYATTTEVYPDSPTADDDQCNRAQVAAIKAGLLHIIAAERL